MTKFLLYIVALVCVAAMVYGSYWVAKTVSYTIFYEDMVKDTVRQMVKDECLK